MHSLDNSIFKREIQRPSEAKLWQMPAATELPRLPFSPRRSEPLEVQATSYLAASDNIFNFSSRVRDDDKYIVIKSFRMYVLIIE